MSTLAERPLESPPGSAPPPTALPRHIVKRNFWSFFVDGAGFPIGLVFLSLTTVLPAFVSNLTTSKHIIGLVAVFFSLGINAPGLIGAYFAERLPRKKPLVITLTIIERLAVLSIFPATLWLHNRPGTLLVVFLTAWSVFTVTLGINFPGYSAMIAKAVPATRRGRLWGWSGAASSILGLVGGFTVRRLLEHQPFPYGYASCFLIGALVLTLSMLPIFLVHETAEQPDRPPPFPQFARRAFVQFHHDRGLLWFAVSQGLYYTYWMGLAFYAVYAKEAFEASDAYIGGTLNIIGVAAAFGASLVWGFLGDRFGNRLTVNLAIAAAVIAPVIALVAPNLLVFSLVFVFVGIIQSGGWLAPYNLLLELAPTRQAATYTALWRLLVVPAAAGSPALAGVIIERFGYQPAFILAAALPLLALLTMRRVPEPRHRAHPTMAPPVAGE